DGFDDLRERCLLRAEQWAVNYKITGRWLEFDQVKSKTCDVIPFEGELAVYCRVEVTGTPPGKPPVFGLLFELACMDRLIDYPLDDEEFSSDRRESDDREEGVEFEDSDV